MIDMIEILIHKGTHKVLEALLIPNKNLAYINEKKVSITEQDINKVLDIIFLWKKDYGTKPGIDLEEYHITITSNNEETKYHGKGYYPNTYKELKNIVGDLYGRTY